MKNFRSAVCGAPDSYDRDPRVSRLGQWCISTSPVVFNGGCISSHEMAIPVDTLGRHSTSLDCEPTAQSAVVTATGTLQE